MRVEDRMTKNISSCITTDNLDRAASQLWQQDCGCLPVVDDDGHLQGMITDRDICMAAFTTGKKLVDLRVGDAMASNVASTCPTDSLQAAQMAMRARGVRRLPVIDDQNRVIGMLCCNDLFRWVDDGGANGTTANDAVHLVRTLATVGRPRTTPRMLTILSDGQAAKPVALPAREPANRKQPAPAADKSRATHS